MAWNDEAELGISSGLLVSESHEEARDFDQKNHQGGAAAVHGLPSSATMLRGADALDSGKKGVNS